MIFYSGLQVNNIFVLGNQKISAKDLQKIGIENAGASIIKFWKIDISSKSIFLADLGKINKEIFKAFPSIEKIQINKNFPNSLLITVTERSPIGVFCDSNTACFLFDKNGVAFERITASADNFIIVRQIAGGEVIINQAVVDKNTVEIILKAQKSLADNFKVGLKEAIVASSGRLNLITKDNWQIYFDLDPSSDINLQITKLNLVLNGEISKDNIKNLRYIDLRPKDRAIICDNKTCGG